MYVSGHANYEHMPLWNAAILGLQKWYFLDGCEPFHTFAQNIDWWYMLESVNHNLSLVLRTLVFGVPDQVLYKPGWIITEDG